MVYPVGCNTYRFSFVALCLAEKVKSIRFVARDAVHVNPTLTHAVSTERKLDFACVTTTCFDTTQGSLVLLEGVV